MTTTAAKITVQAARVRDALKAIGLKHGGWRSGGDFTVETTRTRKLDRSSGLRYTEYGDAYAHTQNRKAAETIEQHAEELAAQGISVTLLYSSGKPEKIVTAIVSSHYNPRHKVDIHRDGEWSYREART